MVKNVIGALFLLGCISMFAASNNDSAISVGQLEKCVHEEFMLFADRNGDLIERKRVDLGLVKVESTKYQSYTALVIKATQEERAFITRAKDNEQRILRLIQFNTDEFEILIEQKSRLRGWMESNTFFNLQPLIKRKIKEIDDSLSIKKTSTV